MKMKSNSGKYETTPRGRRRQEIKEVLSWWNFRSSSRVGQEPGMHVLQFYFGAMDVCYGTNDGAFHGIGAVAMAMVLGLLAM
jgi:hypothetical protein